MAYKLAEAQTMAYNPEQLRPNAQKPIIFVYSDGRVLDLNELTVNGNVQYRPMGTADCQNIAIVALNARRNYERPTEVQVFARLANFGPQPIKTDVVLTVDGETRGTATDLLLLPERWTDQQRQDASGKGMMARDSVSFPQLTILSSAVIRLEQTHKEGDALSADDSAQVVVPPPRQLKVMLVTEGNYFLEKALASLPNIKQPDIVVPETYESKPSDQYDVIMFDRYTPKHLPPSGNFMYFGCVPDPSLHSTLTAQRVQGHNLLIKDLTVLDWERDQPILRGLNLSKLYAAQGLELQVPKTDEVLVQGFKAPLVVLHREDHGTSIAVCFDVIQSNWPLKMSFPVFMNNAMQFLALGSDMDVRESFSPGATPSIPHVDLQKAGNPTEVKVTGPDFNRTIKVPPTGDFVLPPLNRVGLYTTDPPIPRFEKIAVNMLDANESNLVPIDHTPGDPTSKVSSASGKSRLELWWWIVACGALPLLMVEWWVYTRRVHM
jgi:hypothetical protein